ncbi:MAG: DinB family protein [Chitinophagaceae bacterium]|nr:DinB family protein [Anaerolineae bacterium]
MNADDFRHLYDYHFTINRKIWEQCIVPLTDEQFTQKVDYGVGSIHHHVVHLMSVDARWFSGLREVEDPGALNPADFATRALIREKWDLVELDMRTYLAGLRDEMLQTQPFLEADEDPIKLWQVLLHVVNHSTDHRAQLLRLLNQAGITTFAQDYAYFIYGQM